jgi:hypothetical protein
MRGGEGAGGGITTPCRPSVAGHVPARGPLEFTGAPGGCGRRRRGTSPRSASLLVSGMYLGDRSERDVKRRLSVGFEPNTCHYLRRRPAGCEFSWLAGHFSLSRRVSPCRVADRGVAVSTDAWRKRLMSLDGRCAPSAVSRTATDALGQRHVPAGRRRQPGLWALRCAGLRLARRVPYARSCWKCQRRPPRTGSGCLASRGQGMAKGRTRASRSAGRESARLHARDGFLPGVPRSLCYSFLAGVGTVDGIPREVDLRGSLAPQVGDGNVQVNVFSAAVKAGLSRRAAWLTWRKGWPRPASNSMLPW